MSLPLQHSNLRELYRIKIPDSAWQHCNKRGFPAFSVLSIDNYYFFANWFQADKFLIHLSLENSPDSTVTQVELSKFESKVSTEAIRAENFKSHSQKVLRGVRISFTRIILNQILIIESAKHLEYLYPKERLTTISRLFIKCIIWITNVIEFLGTFDAVDSASDGLVDLITWFPDRFYSSQPPITSRATIVFK